MSNYFAVNKSGKSIPILEMKATSPKTIGHLLPREACGVDWDWGGDLATAMSDTENYMEESEDDKSYQEIADIVVGNANKFSFTYTDLCTDADAIEVAKLISSSTSTTNSFSQALETYYSNLVQNRFTYLVNDINCLPNLTALRETIYSKMTDLVEYAVLIEGLAHFPSVDAVKACCNSLANYVYKEL